MTRDRLERAAALMVGVALAALAIVAATWPLWLVP